MSERVKSSSLVRLAPRINGERVMAQRVNSVRASSRVKRESRGSPQPGRGGKGADGKHIFVWPGAWPYVAAPVNEAAEGLEGAHGKFPLALLRNVRPDIPMVVGDAPHLGVLGNFGGVIQGRRARRKTEHDGAACLLDSRGDLANFTGLV